MKKRTRFNSAASLFATCAVLVGFCVAPIEFSAANDEEKYSVDFSKKVGELKPLNGVNLWAKFSTARITDGQKEAEACNFSTVRLHDAPWDSNGQRLVDVQQIFGNLDADPSDPKNYFFKATDDYIANIQKADAVPIYRLGTSIEHTLKPYFAKKPQDPAKYAEICAAIVRHYNAGWADGFEWNLPYWEIWNEPNLVPNMWDDPDWNSYVDFYIVVAKRLRAEFPNIKIGGPALTHADLGMIGRLADRCREEGAPLDFVSWHSYPKTPEEVLNPPFAVRKLLDEKGFEKTELHLNEWHYFPCEWSEIHGTEGGWKSKEYWVKAEEGLHGVDSAAFNAFVMSRWQDGPLTMSNYYAYALDNWGFFETYGKPRKTYYSMVAYGELVKTAPNRVQTVDGGGRVSLLGGVGDDGAKRLLVSIFKRDGDGPIAISLSGVDANGTATVFQIDAESDAAYETSVEYANGVLTLNPGKSGVYLIRF